MSELRQKAIAGAAWMVGMRLTINLLGIVSTIVLARLLTPADFGVVALAGSAYAFFSVLGQLGFDSALIHLKDPEPSHYNTAWTANILIGLAIALATVAIAHPAAVFFRDPRIEPVVYCFSLLSLAKGFENIGVVNFRKSLAFRGDFNYFVVPKIVSVIVGVSAAYVMRNYWALVIGIIASQTAGLIYSHVSQPFRPRLSFAHFGQLFRFSRWMLTSNLLNYVSINGLEILLGKMRDASVVGLFGIARQLAFLPTTEISAPINRALFPSFSTIADDVDRLQSVFRKVLSATATITIPSAFGLLVLADLLVPAVFGGQWAGAGPILSILAIVGAINAAQGLIGPLLLARGKPRILTKAQLINVVIVIPAAAILVVDYGATGVAYAMLAGSILRTPILVNAIRKEINVTLHSLLLCIWRPAIASITMAVAVVSIEPSLSGMAEPGVLILLLLICFGVVVYATALFLLWRLVGKPAGPEAEFLKLLSAYIPISTSHRTR